MVAIAVPDLNVYVPRFRIEIEGESLPATAVISITVDENMTDPCKFDITLNEGLDMETQRFTWLGNPFLNPGNRVEIFFGYVGKEEKSIFKGTIKALSPSFPSSGIPSLTVEGYDNSKAMAKRRTEIRDTEVTYSDIARELAAAYDLGTSGIEDTEETHPRVERQQEENDYRLLRRLADDLGFECFVQSAVLYFRSPGEIKDDGKLVGTFEYRKNFLSFNPRLSTDALVESVTVHGANEDDAEPIVGTAELNDLGSGDEISSLKQLVESSEGSEPKRIESETLSSEDEARDIAKRELKKAINSFITGSMECVGNANLRIGNSIKIEGLGEMFSGYYYITSARHTIGDGGYKTRLEVRRIIV
ncbi:hypothetical protein DRN85_08845 [Methanosarcinales archaeon]|nr:MAG: hypothetical protein DRN85_08845 [Methanosarcinales archaeon]